MHFTHQDYNKPSAYLGNHLTGKLKSLRPECNDEVPTFLGLRRPSHVICSRGVRLCDATCDAALDCPGCSERCCDSDECAERINKFPSFRSSYSLRVFSGIVNSASARL